MAIMSPSTSIQSRISALEALKDQKQSQPKPKIINDFGELVDGVATLGDATNILEEPIPPTAESFLTIAPSPTPSPLNRVHSLSGSDAHSPSPSPPGLGRKTSLLDLNDWVVDVEGPNVSSVTGTGTALIGGLPQRWQPPPSPTASINTRPLPPRRKDMPERATSTRPTTNTTAPLIQLEPDIAPPKSKSAPPIPPKKIPANKLTNGKSIVSGHLPTRDPSSSTSVSPTPSVLPLPKRTDSLTVEPQHVYPPFLKLDIAPNGRGRHAPASSVSSFHSVSLSDGGDTGTPNSVTNFVFTHPMDQNVTGNTNGSGNNGGGDDSGSLDESFENVSTISSSYSYDFAYGSFPPNKPQIPPRLPERPNKLRTNHPTNSTFMTQTAITSPPRSPIHLPLTRVSSSSSTTSSRRMPPPPPPHHRNSVASRTIPSRGSPPSTSASDRSSILSTATTGTSYTSGSSHTPTINNSATGSMNPSSNKFARQPPIPASARHRYEKLFYANVDVRKKTKLDKSHNEVAGLLGVPGVGASRPTSIKKARKAAGWRGLSVDLVTNPAENLPSLPPSQPGSRRGSIESAGSAGVMERGKDDRLEGVIVRRIWMCSNLDREKLRAIWYDLHFLLPPLPFHSVTLRVLIHLCFVLCVGMTARVLTPAPSTSTLS